MNSTPILKIFQLIKFNAIIYFSAQTYLPLELLLIWFVRHVKRYSVESFGMKILLHKYFHTFHQTSEYYHNLYEFYSILNSFKGEEQCSCCLHHKTVDDRELIIVIFFIIIQWQRRFSLQNFCNRWTFTTVFCVVYVSNTKKKKNIGMTMVYVDKNIL